jgi:hypothetical protein
MKFKFLGNYLIFFVSLFFFLQDILSLQTVVLHIDIHPRYLIPDTNCFVDDLTSIKSIANAYPLYQLMIPITGKKNNVSILFILCCTINIPEKLKTPRIFKTSR